MRNLLLFAAASVIGQAGAAAPLSAADREAVARLPAQLTTGWLHNDRAAIMRLFTPEAVFIPHDGVRPHRGKAAIEGFWFPTGVATGKVTSFLMSADDVSGDSKHAVVWGRSDLHWQNHQSSYHWPGYYLISARRTTQGWRITHLMSSDEQPTSEPLR